MLKDITIGRKVEVTLSSNGVEFAYYLIDRYTAFQIENMAEESALKIAKVSENIPMWKKLFNTFILMKGERND